MEGLWIFLVSLAVVGICGWLKSLEQRRIIEARTFQMIVTKALGRGNED